MFIVCDECRRLWRGLKDATAAAIRIDNKLKIAVLQHDHEKVIVLTSQTEAAFAARDQMHETIRQHEAAEHH